MTSPMKAPSDSSKSESVAPRVFPSTGFDTVPETTLLEEENFEFYNAELFYPVHIGEIFDSRYQVLYKIGYGTTSTVWMCRDLSLNRYVCMKAMIKNYPSVSREVNAYEKLADMAKNGSDQLGMENVRLALACFWVTRGEDEHCFLIHDPLGFSLDQLQDRMGTFSPFLAQHYARGVLRAVHFVHSADIAHADVYSDNVLLSIEDKTILEELEEDEFKNPSARKITERSAVFAYKESDFRLTRWAGGHSCTILCDFGEARIGKQEYEVPIQPTQYRAPEIILHLPWSTPVDIWSFACMTWYFATRRNLFPSQGDSEPNEGVHLARMAMLLGPPPQSLLKESGQRGLQFFNEDGSSKYDVPSMTLESVLASHLEGNTKAMTSEQQATYLAFIRRALRWEADRRASALELLEDPYFAKLFLPS